MPAMMAAAKNNEASARGGANPSTAVPLTTGCGIRTLYPERFQLALEVREIQASVSPTPFVVDPGVASGDCIAVLRFAVLHPKSPGLA